MVTQFKVVPGPRPNAGRAKPLVAQPLLPCGSGRMEQCERPRWSAGRRTRGQAQMGEDRGDHGRLFVGADDRQRTAAVRAVLQVDVEDALE